MLSQEQFEVIRSDLQGMAKQFFSEMRGEMERIAAAVASPYRNRAGAAGHMQCSQRVVDEFLAEGKLPKYWVGSKPLVKVSDLDALIAKESINGRKRIFQRKANQC